jgi:hypothetical protein
MRRTIGRAALAVALSTLALPASAAGEAAQAGRPDLSVVPPERDPVLLLLAKDPDLYARAASGTNMSTGGTALAVLGGIAIPVGFYLFLVDAWTAGVEAHGGEQPRTNPRGLLITTGGVAAIVGGILLVREGDARRISAVDAYNARHAAGPPAR